MVPFKVFWSSAAIPQATWCPTAKSKCGLGGSKVVSVSSVSISLLLLFAKPDRDGRFEVDLVPDRFAFMCPMVVSTDFGRCFLTQAGPVSLDRWGQDE